MPPRPCLTCGTLTLESYCLPHRTMRDRTKHHKAGRTTGRRSQAMTQQIIQRDGYICQLQLPGCTTLATTKDHIVSLKNGGRENDMNNLQASCLHCNSSKGANRNR